MYWGYVVEICRRDMLWTYVAEIRWSHRQWVYAILQGYVVDIRWLHRAWVYGGARNVGGCGVSWGGVMGGWSTIVTYG